MFLFMPKKEKRQMFYLMENQHILLDVCQAYRENCFIFGNNQPSSRLVKHNIRDSAGNTDMPDAGSSIRSERCIS